VPATSSLEELKTIVHQGKMTQPLNPCQLLSHSIKKSLICCPKGATGIFSQSQIMGII